MDTGRYDHLVGLIYDCAADPGLWPDTLAAIRDEVRGAYAMIGLSDVSHMAMGRAVTTVTRTSGWDESWITRLPASIRFMPGVERLANTEVDTSWVQLRDTDAQVFHSSQFFKEWVEPQGLADAINVPFLRRPSTMGILTVTAARDRGAFRETDWTLTERLAPHVRRTLAIGDLVDKGNIALALHRSALDQLSVAVFLLDGSGVVAFANAKAETLLAEATLVVRTLGVLSARRPAGPAGALADAIARAANGDAALGLKGIGVPLIDADGSRAAAYVLPIAASDRRRMMGEGHCAVFIARRGEQQPVAIEILRTLYDLTTQEARVASLVAAGDGPAAISQSLGLSIHTIRSHLAHCYAKTGAADQTALGALVNALVPPLASG